MKDFVIKLNLFDSYLTVDIILGVYHWIAIKVFIEVLILWIKDPYISCIEENLVKTNSDVSIYLSFTNIN